jgi:hypothetical protein
MWWRSGEPIHRSILGLRSQTLRRSSPQSRLELQRSACGSLPFRASDHGLHRGQLSRGLAHSFRPAPFAPSPTRSGLATPYFGVWVLLLPFLLLLALAVRSDAGDKYAAAACREARNTPRRLASSDGPSGRSDYGVSARGRVSCGLSERAWLVRVFLTDCNASFRPCALLCSPLRSSGVG